MFSRILRAVFAVVALVAGVVVTADSPSVTFHKDVESILQKNCQTCHRPGQVAPTSFMTYESARPYTRAMKAAVLSRKMPPWFADPQYGPYVNDRSLSQRDIDTIVSWADAGAPEGPAGDAPVPTQWPQGWFIKPDIIVDGPTTAVPATVRNNVVEWITVDHAEWVQEKHVGDLRSDQAGVRRGHAPPVHQLCAAQPELQVWRRLLDGQGARRRRLGAARQGRDVPGTGRDEKQRRRPDSHHGARGAARPAAGRRGDCYLPGNFAADYRPIHAAKLIPAGSDITFNLHYTPNGRAVTDHVKVGFTTIEKAPERQYVSFLTTSPTDPKRFAIPPNTPNWESPPAEVTFLQDAELVYLMPHMHARGKDMTYSLEYPDGRKQVILSVPRYDFNWQLGYNVSIKVPKGTKLHVDAHFDNSAGNRSNPNPNKTVYYGSMTWEEMMNPFYSVVVPVDVDPRNVVRSKYQQVGGGGYTP